MTKSLSLRWSWILVGGLLLGCSSQPPSSATNETGEASTGHASTGEAATEKAGGVIGEGDQQPASTTASPAVTSTEQAKPAAPAAPFVPPPLADLDAKAGWKPLPVLDARKLLRQQLATEKPLVSVEEALKLRNDNLDANRKILSALGRLPDDDKMVNYDATLVRRVKGDIKSVNPILVSSVEESDVGSYYAMNFFGFDWRMRPFASADLVRSWETSEDGLYHKLVIRDDLTWSDGRPITAHDIEFSYRTIMDPEVPVPAVRSGTDELKSVHAFDDFTVVYFHKEARPTSVWDVNFPVIPKHVYEQSVKTDKTLVNSDYHVKLESAPVTGGAYIIKSRIPKQEIVLERRDSYYMHNGKQVREKDYFKEVRFKIITDANTSLLALRTGSIEEMELDADQWRTEQTNNDEFYARNTKATATEWVEFHVVWNCKDPFFADPRVRKAMSWAFDHQEMLDKLFYDLYEPAVGPFHPTAWMAPKKPLQPYKQDLDRAEKLLEEAGWADGDGDGVLDKMIGGKSTRFEFSLQCTNTPASMKVCELWKESLDRIGVLCNVRPLEPTVHQQRLLEHNFQAAFGGWGTGTDPDSTKNIFASTGERNYGQYFNAQVDQLFKDGMREFDQEKRAAIYAKIQELLYEEQPYTWLYYRNAFYGFNKTLRGYRFSPRGPYTYNPGVGSLWKAATP